MRVHHQQDRVAGATFKVPRNKPHEEKYGPAGATSWAAHMN